MMREDGNAKSNPDLCVKLMTMILLHAQLLLQLVQAQTSVAEAYCVIDQDSQVGYMTRAHA